MAIGTGDAIEKFGTQTAITDPAIAINSGAMSTQGNAVAWTNTDDAPEADILVEATFAAAPTANGTMSIYARKLNVRSTNDENTPTLTDNEDKRLGSFKLDSGLTTQVKTKRVLLPNGKASQEYEFYYKNNGGQNITSCQSWITPIALGPAA